MQNFKNHKRYQPLYHFVTVPLLAIGMTGALINLYKSLDGPGLYSASLLVLLFIITTLVAFFSRYNALVNQNRTIRAEENFRYFAISGKRMPGSVRMSQVIALRFASDEELPALVEKAATEQLKPAEIKQQIKNWRADRHRV